MSNSKVCGMIGSETSMMRKQVPNQFFILAAETLRQGTSVKMRVEGNSMAPFIRGGKDLIELIPYTGQELPLWCAVFYEWKEQYMTHRLIRQEDEMCYMLGDGNVYRVETLPRDQIIGVLNTIIHPNGTTTDCLSSDWLKKGERWNRLRPFWRKQLLRVLKYLRPLL